MKNEHFKIGGQSPLLEYEIERFLSTDANLHWSLTVE